jgi:hypothetical protein
MILSILELISAELLRRKLLAIWKSDIEVAQCCQSAKVVGGVKASSCYFASTPVYLSIILTPKVILHNQERAVGLVVKSKLPSNREVISGLVT